MTKPHRWRRIAAWSAAIIIGVYALAVGGLYFAQRSFMYFPDPGYAPPDTRRYAIQEVRLATADGETLRAWYLPPQPGKPVILHFSGNGASLQIQEGRWRRIGAAGVGFLAVAYRGYSGSTGHPTEEGLHQDASAGYAWLRQRYPAEDIVIYGHSLGSGVATRLASEVPERALVLEAPFSAAVDRAHEQYPWAPVSLLMLDQFKSRDVIGKVRAPILIIHGDRDSVIPFAHGQRLYALAPSPKTFVEMIGSDHNTLTRDGAYDAVWKFLGIPVSHTAAKGHETGSRVTASAGRAVALTDDQAVDLALAAVRRHPELTSLPVRCLGFSVDEDGSLADAAVVTVRESHSHDCGGDPETSPRLFDLTVDRKTRVVTFEGVVNEEIRPL